VSAGRYPQWSLTKRTTKPDRKRAAKECSLSRRLSSRRLTGASQYWCPAKKASTARLAGSEAAAYFTDQKGGAVFWLGTTQWQLFRAYTLDEARTIVEKTKSRGFAFAQVMLLAILKRVFLERYQWWELVPDQAVLASGGQTVGRILNLAARHKEGRWIIVYLADQAALTTDMTKLKGSDAVNARWIDPRTGEVRASGRFPTSGIQPFSSPEGWQDALLVLEP
jgi:hypothetical protein